jgi:hypothetical protein
MNSHLRQYFEKNNKNLMHKWMHYFEVYERHFARFRGTDVHLLEIGVSHGGSLQMWKDYFGPRAKIFGADVNPDCKKLEEDQVQIFIGDQGDRKFLRLLAREIPRVDILIDDGGHTMRQQIATFEELYGRVSENGVYLCEDTHTSYWPAFRGGLRRRGTFMEYSKRLIDQLNAWHSQQRSFKVDDFTKSTDSMHFYDSIVVFEKRPRQPPEVRKTGAERVKYAPEKFLDKLKRRL